MDVPFFAYVRRHCASPPACAAVEAKEASPPARGQRGERAGARASRTVMPIHPRGHGSHDRHRNFRSAEEHDTGMVVAVAIAVVVGTCMSLDTMAEGVDLRPE